MSKLELIFLITGGIFSGIGKGIFVGSLGSIIDAYQNTNIIKIDPYFNYSAGNLNPGEHGEVYVTEDGYESDLDLGYYEKYLGRPFLKKNNLTGGQINGFFYDLGLRFSGKTLTLNESIFALSDKIILENSKYKILIIELGGTLGDIESYWIAELYKCLNSKVSVRHIHIVPNVKVNGGEIKTKPAQTYVNLSLRKGMPIDLLVIRDELCNEIYYKKKLSFLGCKIKVVPFVKNIWEMPFLLLEWMKEYLKDLGIKIGQPKYVLQTRVDKTAGYLLMINKYDTNKQAYWHLVNDLERSSEKINRERIEVRNFYVGNALNWKKLHDELRDCQGIVLPGGFGKRGIWIYRLAIALGLRYSKPILGICLGKQVMTDYLLSKFLKRKVCSQEFGDFKVPGTMISYEKEEIRLGDRTIFDVDGKSKKARFRNRYVLNSYMNERLKKCVTPIYFSGDNLTEAWVNRELKMTAAQFHPEFHHNLNEIDPLLVNFIKDVKK